MNASQKLQARLSETLRLALVYRLARELNAELHSTDVLRRVLNGTAEALGTPHASIIAVRQKEFVACYALGGGSDANPRPVLERVLANGLAGFVRHNYRTIIINDISSNPLWMPLPDEPLSPQDGSALCVPLIHSGEVVGVMTLAHPIRNYFTADAINFTNTISEMGAGALSNALLLEAARQAEKRFETLFDDAIVPIIITDMQGTIQSINRRACEFLGYGPDELLHQNISVIHRMGTGPVGANRFEHLTRGLEVRFQSAVWSKDDTNRPVQVYVRRFTSTAGGDYIQWIEHDVSSQVKLDQLRRDLSAMTYHDMRGPLGNIHTSLEALKPLVADHPIPQVHTFLDMALQSERKARHMIDSLLDVQYLEEGSKLLTRTNTAIRELITSTVEMVQSLADDKHIEIRFALADDLPLLYIDDNMIERVILNLIDNALKYTPDKGIITVSTSTSGSEVFVHIRDTGPGIAPEAQAAIFNKFSRLKQNNMPHGVGLGLAFCKMAVEAHGGRIWVRSDEPHGSTFTFTLPVEAPATQELPILGQTSP